ncbi:MAG: hypothetical protein GX660_04540 [Clostridiaceae bacterium]|jgi:hypothetical protein|nr:hypothetical protein [Clostridiaceae bacterium]
MSALIYILEENQVIIAMDTLSSINTEAGLKPYKFLTKIFPLMHMNCVLCGTGNFEPILKWFEHIESGIVAYGIIQLNKITELSIKAFMEKENQTNASTTLYQFGLSELDGKFYGYAYRSTNNYSSEKLLYSVGVKPQDAFNTNEELSQLIEGCIDQDVLAALMLKLKEYDDNLGNTNPKKVGIGGQMEICLLQKNSIQLLRQDIFPDCEAVYTEILDGCSTRY